MSKIIVHSGALQGRQFESLFDLLEEQQQLIDKCDHSQALSFTMIVGKDTNKPKLVTGLDCPTCRERQEISRVAITNPAHVIEGL